MLLKKKKRATRKLWFDDDKRSGQARSPLGGDRK